MFGTGRVAIVTGAGGGLGRQHALYLARHGVRVVVNDLAPGEAESVAAEIHDAGGQALAVAGSVTDRAAVEALVAEAVARWSRVDILINNAGILRDKSFGKMTFEDFRLVMDVHVMGAVVCTKAVWDIMRAQHYGRVVMTTSSSGLFGSFGQANYSAAKMALVGLMQTLSLEGEKYDIRVNCLAPTAATQMTQGIMLDASLDRLDPALVSPALSVLAGEDAPTRAILCAGAGHFAQAAITLSAGQYIGSGAEAGENLAARLDAVSDRTGDVVPAYGLVQSEREVASAERHALAARR